MTPLLMFIILTIVIILAFFAFNKAGKDKMRPDKAQQGLLEINKFDSSLYSIDFTDFDMFENIMPKLEVVLDGHVLETAVEGYCIDKNIELEGVEFDSESDMFAAYSDNRFQLEKIKGVIESFIKHPTLLTKYTKNIKEDEWFTPAQYIEHLKYNNMDLTKTMTFSFQLEFDNDNSAREACKVAINNGYSCYLGQDYENSPIVALIDYIPDLRNIQESYDFFLNLSKQFSGTFDYFDNVESSEFESLKHWTLFVND